MSPTVQAAVISGDAIVLAASINFLARLLHPVVKAAVKAVVDRYARRPEN